MKGTAALAGALLLSAATASAEVPLEEIGRTEVLGQPRAHWVLVSDILLQRSALLDLDAGRFLGMLSTGFLSPAAVFPGRGEIFYLPETYYSRGSRGERTDLVTFYDTRTLAPIDEVAIPPKRAINILPGANAAISDDDRFLAVFNMTPATSLSIVDVAERRFAGELAAPGCSLVFAAGARRFLMLCSDGSLLQITLDDRGGEASRWRGEPFFDPASDPVTEKAVRWGDRWVFVSFEGYAHPVDVSGETPKVEAAWSLVSDADRKNRWRIGGLQHLAVHQATGRLFSLMHQGGVDTHKEPGTELWVYDLAERKRRERLELRHPGLSFLSETIEVGTSWPRPFDGLWGWLLDHAVPNPGLHSVQITQDAAPLLVTGSQIGGSVAVYDATSGELLRRVSTGNLTTHALQAPWGAAP